MKKSKIAQITMISLLTLSLSAALFTGCSKTGTQATTTSSNTQAASSTASSPQDKFGTVIKDSLAALVTDGTINQTQSDKISAALTAASQNAGAPGKSGNAAPAPSASPSSTANNSGSTQPAGGPGGPGGNGGPGGFNSTALSQLVTDNVITQAQADAVTKKISASMPVPGSGNANNSAGTNNAANTN